MTQAVEPRVLGVTATRGGCTPKQAETLAKLLASFAWGELHHGLW